MTAAPATTIPLLAARCRDCKAPIVWTLRGGKRLALDTTPIEVVRYDSNLVDAVVWRADLERVLTDTGETLSGWRVPPEVRPDLPRVRGRTGHWGNCYPDDPIGRDRRVEELATQRDRAGWPRAT